MPVVLGFEVPAAGLRHCDALTYPYSSSDDIGHATVTPVGPQLVVSLCLTAGYTLGASRML
jgi:hypothetical protein